VIDEALNCVSYSFQAREHCLTLLQSALEENVERCFTGSNFTAADASHLCAISMEYELFSSSKLPVSYKASVMKRVNEVKKLTQSHELHASFVRRAAGEHVDDTVGCFPVSQQSTEDRSSFKHESPVVVKDDDAGGGGGGGGDGDGDGDVNVVPATYCDKDDSALISLHTRELKPFMKSGDCCDMVKSDNAQDHHINVESASVSECMASVTNTDFVNDRPSQKDEVYNRYKASDIVVPSYTVKHLSESSLESESSDITVANAAATLTTATSRKKSVQISDSPPTISYISPQYKVHNSACNGVKVS